jgi:hypothetical protein
MFKLKYSYIYSEDKLRRLSMEEKKYCEFSIEGVIECSEEGQKEIQKKINEAVAKIMEEEGLIRVDVSVQKYTNLDVALSIVSKSDGPVN